MARRRGDRRARGAGAASPLPEPSPQHTSASTAPGSARRRAHQARSWLRWRPLTTVPSILLALLGVLGLATTVRSAPPPPTNDPVRYLSGPPLAERLVILQVPQLDERGLIQLRALLGAGDASEGALFMIERPSFASFDDISLLLLAGNEAADATPPIPNTPSNRLPDTIVRSLMSQGRQVALIGPATWQALIGAAPASTPAPGPAPKIETLLTEASSTLREKGTDLVVIDLRDLALRDLRDETGGLRELLSSLGATLTSRDTLLLIGNGGLGEPLHLSLSGAGTSASWVRALPLNDLAPTCVVLLGTAYPFESRGRIAWPLLDVTIERKARATTALARQRMTLASRLVPFGASYPPGLVNGLAHLVELDEVVDAGQYAFAYQLAASSVDDADRLVGTVPGVVSLPPPRRFAWVVAIPCLIVALAGIALAMGMQSWGALAAAITGALFTLGLWVGLSLLFRQAIVPRLGVLAALTLLQALGGGFLTAWLYRQRLFAGRAGEQPYRPGRATELLVMIAALPIAVCAYRYGLPWQLRLEEVTPLFRWRSALLAPIGLLLAGYGWAFLAPPRSRRTNARPE